MIDMSLCIGLYLFSSDRKNIFSRTMVWFGLVLWHINHFRLFNAKFFLYIYIKYMISKHILQITFLNESELILFI